jgi:hypothetical protein
MHRAAVRDRQQAGALLVVKIAVDGDFALDAVDLAFLGFTVFAIGGVNLVVAQRDGNPLER